MLRLLTLFGLCLFMANPALALPSAQTNASDIEWLDLVPEQERQAAIAISNAMNHEGGAAQQLTQGNVREELSGTKVRIPGYVIPLEGDSETITEFLLVPFYGACIHVPPPPPNQIIHVKFEKGAPTQDLWDVVYITGELSAESIITEDIGVESGYSIAGASIELFDEA